MTDEAAPSTPTFVGVTKPKFEGFEPKPTADVGFSRDIDEPGEPERPQSNEAATPQVQSPVPQEAEESQDNSEEQTALVVTEPGGARTKIVPHLEIDYSKYQIKVDYMRVDPTIRLRSVQGEAVDTYFSETSKRRVIISLPTGAGKSVTGLTIASRINGRVLWIAHRDELIEQPANEIVQNFPGLDFGIDKANQRDGVGRRLVISSIQTLSRKNRIAPLMHGAPFQLVIYDECHHATSAQSMRVLSWLGCFREDGLGPRLLGLTATIERSDKTSLGHVFEDVIYSLSIQEAIKLGFLVPPKPIKVYLPFQNLRKGKDGDVSISDADREARRLGAAKANATTIALNCGSRKTIVFTTSVDQAKRTAEECELLGLKAEWASGAPYMNKAERRAAIKRFSSGETQVLCSSELLVEGFDDRSVGAVVIARQTRSKSRYLQMLGRGLRTHTNKVDCLVIDITSTTDMGLMTADILLQKPDKKIKRKPRRRTEIAVDSNTEWTRLQSYLRSARIDTIEHGEITFARATDDLIVTAAMDSHLVILRRVGKDGEDLWVIEHRGIVYTMEPLTLQECMSVCDTLMPSFGGGAKPDSPEWGKATDGPAPPPGIMPTAPVEPTAIVSPASAQLPLAMKFVTGADPVELAEEVNHDLMNANAASFARGLRLAFAKKKCHLLDITKVAPENRHKWGWVIPKSRVPMPASIGDERGPMIGWVYRDMVCVDPAAVEIARQMLRDAGEKDVDIKTSMLRTHLGTVNRTFKDVRRDWIKVRRQDVEPSDDEIEEPS